MKQETPKQDSLMYNAIQRWFTERAGNNKYAQAHDGGSFNKFAKLLLDGATGVNRALKTKMTLSNLRYFFM